LPTTETARCSKIRDTIHFMRLAATAFLTLALAPIAISQLTFSSGGLAEVGGARVFFESAVGSVEFWEGLRKVEASSGTTYMKGSDAVRFFPDPLLIRIFAVQCTTSSKKKISEQFMKGLHFEAKWKRGINLRRVKQLALAAQSERHVSGQGDVWVYDLKLDESEVPLDDHLIVDILAADSKRILRMSFSLHENELKSR
jgi:hypothetical protein